MPILCWYQPERAMLSTFSSTMPILCWYQPQCTMLSTFSSTMPILCWYQPQCTMLSTFSSTMPILCWYQPQCTMLSTFSSTMPILCWYQASTDTIRENIKNTAHSSWYCTFFGTVHTLQIFMQSNIAAKIHLMACILGVCIFQLTSPATERYGVRFHDITAS